MAQKRKISLTAAAFMAGASGIASAATVSQTVTTPSTLKNFTATQTFFGFNPGSNGVPLGSVLTSVTDTLTDTVNGILTLTNIGSTTGSFQAAAQDQITKSFPAGFTVNTTVTGNTITGTLNSGISSSAASSGTGSTSASSTAASVLAAFTTANPITASIHDVLATTLTAIGPVTASSTGSGAVTDTLVYGYTPGSPPPPPPPGVPEPATLSLLGSGLVGIGLARLARRRRKS